LEYRTYSKTPELTFHFDHLNISHPGEAVAQTSHVKYLRIHLDQELDRKEHLTKKRNELHIRPRSMYWLFQVQNKVSIANKRLLYITISRPTGPMSELRGCIADSDSLHHAVFTEQLLKKRTSTNKQLWKMQPMKHDFIANTKNLVNDASRESLHSILRIRKRYV